VSQPEDRVRTPDGLRASADTHGAGEQRGTAEQPAALKGRKLGDRRVRVERPHSPYSRYTPAGLEAREAASRPTTPAGRL
jgi:hypothetical protein